MLCFILLFWGILEVKDLLYYSSTVFRYNFISNLLILIDLLAIPVGCSLIFELLHHGWTTWRRIVVGSLPFMIGIIAYSLTRAEWIVPAMFIFVIAGSLVLVSYLIWAVRRHHRMLRDNFSYTEHINLRWLSGVALLLTICFVGWTLSCYYSSWIVDSAYQLFLILLWSVIGYYTCRQQPVRETMVDAEVAADKTKVIDKEHFNFRHELDRLMSEERIWLEPQLTLSDLAVRVGTNRTYLSVYLNSVLQTTFYDYINTYRIEAALRMLEDPTCTATMAEISESCGFNSTSTFRRVLYSRTGRSFASYRT